MRIVSNTGPLIGLAKIDRLSILKDIASEVIIPPMVHRELLGKTGIESERIDNALNGILLLAKEKGILENIALLIDELRSQGYWISDEVANLAKGLAGEK